MLREIDAKTAQADADRATPIAPRERRAATPAVAVLGAAAVAAQLERLLAQSRRQRGRFALVSVSVEHIADAATGEAGAGLEHDTREEVARRIRARIRSTDLLLRESERDFWALLPGADEEAALRVVERFVRALNGPYRIDESRVRVGVRVGCAAHPEHGLLATELQRRATERLCG